MKIKNIIKPTPLKALVALIIVLLIPLLDYLTIFCSGDMCFNGIYRLAGNDMYRYFFLANVLKYIVIILLLYSLISFCYLTVVWAIAKFKKQKFFERQIKQKK